MRQLLHFLPVTAVALLVTGCILPFPSRTCTREGLAGRVVDGRSGAPVPGASVCVTYAVSPLYEQSGDAQAACGRDGKFRVDSQHLQHWFYIFGVALNHRWPHPDHFGGPDLPASVLIQHPGYEPLTYAFQRLRQETALPDRPILTPLPEQSRTYRLIPQTPSQ